MVETESIREERIHIWVTGRVQGVGFRAFAQHAAVVHNLTGWVRNISYDTVEVVAEGSHDRLVSFAEELRIGSRPSRVDETRVGWETSRHEFTAFQIK
jgi:acylphosphatase